MKVRDIYERLVVQVDNSEKGIAVDRYRAVLALNEALNRVVQTYLNDKSNDRLRHIQSLLVDYTADNQKCSNTECIIELPDNLFEFSSVRGYAKKGECKKVLDFYEMKDQNYTEVVRDENNKPSFKYAESPFSIKDNSLVVYVDNYETDKVVISYYKYPNRVRLIDEDDPESDFDENYGIDLDSKIVDKVITTAAMIITLNNKDSSYQHQQQKTQI